MTKLLTVVNLSALIATVSLAFNTLAQVNITVDITKVLARDVSHKYGMNLNAGVDSDLNRPPGSVSLMEALKKTGVKHLRYPGGKKSLYFSWASAPYTDASTNYWLPGSYANNAKNTLNFDEFMSVANQVGAQAHINVAYNPTKNINEQLAAKWVKYANITNNYNVKYWEIGNEMWQKDLGFNISSLCAVVNSYSSAMKAEDPSIFIGVSWYKNKIKRLIKTCGDALDFVTISDYTTYLGSYQNYAKGNNVKLINVDEKASKKIVISEFAPTTWQKDADDYANTTGKGIINFDQIGQYLLSPNTGYANFWNTHWYSLNNNMFHALDKRNNLLPVAMPMTLWAKFINDDLVHVNADNHNTVTYAAFDKVTNNLNLFIINKGNKSQSANIIVNSENTYFSSAEVNQFQGKDEWDPKPSLKQVESVNVLNNTIETFIPPTSISVISLIIK